MTTSLNKPYFALDIETTGLNLDKSQILEVAMVFDDGISNIDQLPIFHTNVYPNTNYYEPFAMSLHSELLKTISENSNVVDINGLQTNLVNFITSYSNDLPTLAGKNLGTFDLLILKNNGIKFNYSHRIIDVGTLYYIDFGYIPNLNEINQLINYPEVSHKALNDAINIVTAIRYKFQRIN